VRFWDTSALVSLCVVEPVTPDVRRLLDEDSSLIVWWATRTECVSAFARRRREGHLTAATERSAGAVLAALSEAWTEVLPSDPLRSRAERLLGVHALRAADAFQLSAALLWSQGETGGRELVAFDERLREAAEREGFSVRPD